MQIRIKQKKEKKNQRGIYFQLVASQNEPWTWRSGALAAFSFPLHLGNMKKEGRGAVTALIVSLPVHA